jgi:hypothetical protein
MELWLRVEAVARSRQPVFRRSVGDTEQRTTIKTGIKTIRRTNTRVGNEPPAECWRGTGAYLYDIWGGDVEFSPDGIQGAKRHESPDGPIEALVNRYNRSSC